MRTKTPGHRARVEQSQPQLQAPQAQWQVHPAGAHITRLQVGLVTQRTILSRMGWCFMQSHRHRCPGQFGTTPEANHRWLNDTTGSPAFRLVQHALTVGWLPGASEALAARRRA